MKRLLLVFAVMLLSCPTLRAQGGGYRTERAIAYRDAADPASADSLCRLDLYYPTDRPGFATVIWFHGGGLTAGRREIPAALCNQGFAVAGVDYRLVPVVDPQRIYPYPEWRWADPDPACAAGFLREIARKHGFAL